MDAAANRPDPWAAQGIYVRLSRERKRHLLAIAKEVGHLESPVRALAAHIEMSGAALIANADNPLAADDKKNTALVDNISLRLDRITAALADLSDRVADRCNPEKGKASVQLMGAWLSAACSRLKAEDAELILTKARWLRTERSDAESAQVDMDFEVDLLSIDGKPVAAAVVALARMADLPMSCPFTVDQRIKERSIAMVCQRAKPTGWSIAAYSLGEDGELGQTIVASCFSMR